MNRPEHFWHGTHVSLNPGDIVTPRETLGVDSNFETVPETDKTGWNPGNVAYATGSIETAEWYAKRAAEKKGEGRVYKVEPVNPDDLKPDIYGGGDDRPAFQSESGFRVLSEHRSGVCRKCYELRDTEGKCACPDKP
jgi:hypothetical protein